MDNKIYLTILGMGAVTFLTRFAPFLLLRERVLPERLSHTLRYIPIAVLSTLIIPELLLVDGSLSLSFSNLYLVAGSITLLIAWKTKHMLTTVLGGLGCMLLLQLFF